MTYTGHLYDQESGLYYFGARYYDPETGRFLSQDPVAGDALNPPSLHKYLYAYNSPMIYTDPWGEIVDGGDPHRQGMKYSDATGWVPKTREDQRREFEMNAPVGAGLLSTTIGFIPGLETVQDVVGAMGYDLVTLERLSPLDQSISAAALLVPIGGGIIRGPKRAVKGVAHAFEGVLDEAKAAERLAKELEQAKKAEHAASDLAKEAELLHKKANYGEVLKEGGEAESLVKGGEALKKPSAPKAEPSKKAPNGSLKSDVPESAHEYLAGQSEAGQLGPNALGPRKVDKPTAGQGGVYQFVRDDKVKTGSTVDFRDRYGPRNIELEYPQTRMGAAADDAAYQWNPRRQRRFDEEFLDRTVPENLRYRSPVKPVSPVQQWKWEMYRQIFGYGDLPANFGYCP